MQEIHKPHKENQQKDEENPQPAFGGVGALRAPTVDFVYYFEDFP